MANLRLSWRSIARVMLFSTAALLLCGPALAQTNQPVSGFVVINPISVCSNGSCAPYGLSCTTTSGKPVCTKSPAPSSATVNTPIGFVDAATNVNLTRAFWAQAGLDVAFFPVQSYNSPSNTIDPSWNNIKDAVSNVALTSATGGNYTPTTYQTLHIVNVLCADGFIALTSPDFQALTKHTICTDHGGLGSGYQKLANPPAAPSTAPPLAINGCSTALPCSTNSNAIDVFFVNSYLGPGASNPVQYGFSWINGDGVSVQQAIFSNSPGPLPPAAAPRYDTVAHEIGHALALSHTNFGLPFTDPTIIDNLMQVGTTRATSYNSGCQGTPGMLSDFIVGPPPVYTNGALFDLDLPTSSNPCPALVGETPLADQLTLQSESPTSVCSSPLDPTKCLTQQGAAALSPFINKILPNTANAGGGQSSAPLAASANTTTTSTTSTSSSTPAPLQITIAVSGAPNDGNPDLAESIIAIPPSDQLSFSGNQPVTQIGGTGCDPNNIPKGCAVTVTKVVKLSNQQVTGNPGCDSGTGQPPSSQCVAIFYSPGFGSDNTAFSQSNIPPGISVELAVDFNKDATVILTNQLLSGTQYTAISNNGFATTSLFSTTPGTASANSQNPDLTTPNVLLQPESFQNASAAHPPNGNRKLALCTPPFTTVFQKIKGQLVPELVCPDGNLPDGPD